MRVFLSPYTLLPVPICHFRKMPSPADERAAVYSESKLDLYVQKLKAQVGSQSYHLPNDPFVAAGC